jgi:thiopeptide-type bacteriocin biosynthesis protein
LRVIHDQLGRHNDPEVDRAGQADIRARLTSGMRTISGAGRSPLAVDLRLDCEVRLPGRVARDVETAATALARLTRQPTGEPAWRDWYTAFCDRYGTGTQVPLRDAIDPDAGLGYPAGYPGSVLFPPPRGSGSERDEKLLALAWTALQDGSREINLDNDVIRSLAVGDPAAEPRIPPHVEVAARIHATSIEALNNGEYLLTVAPGRSFGTFTSRFTTLTTNSNLSEMYAAVPTSVAGALPVQLSFPPVFPHAENICRVPAYLPHVLSLGEHRRPHHGRPETDRVDADGVEDTATITLEDLAVIATRTGLHLVSVSRQRVVDPQVFHGLALDKQPPPLARFLIHLTRALGASWHVFDWGPAARLLPCLPRVRYGRAILAPARWRVTAAELPTNTTTERWAHSLAEWRALWRCPRIVELADADRTLRLDLDEPAHAAILHADLHRRGHAVLTETVAGPSDYGWIGGHAHEIVFPLTSTRPPEPSPLATARPVVTNRSHGQWPACPDTRWLNAKIHTHPQRLNEFVTEQLPRLLAAFAVEPDWWFIRYRGPHETDHLRLRLRTPDPATYGASLSVLGAWGRHLRDEGRAARLVIDTYSPEVGRYGTGPALVAAENLFVADSRAVAAQLRHLPSTGVHAVHRDALSAANMVAIVEGFLGDTGVAMRWLTGRPAPAGPAADRACRDQVINLLNRGVPNLSGQAAIVARTWQARAGALAAYRAALPAHTDLDAVVESLLHMHHNRLIGPDRDRENTCRRLARQAALTWLAQHDQHRDDQHRDDQ